MQHQCLRLQRAAARQLCHGPVAQELGKLCVRERRGVSDAGQSRKPRPEARRLLPHREVTGRIALSSMLGFSSLCPEEEKGRKIWTLLHFSLCLSLLRRSRLSIACSSATAFSTATMHC